MESALPNEFANCFYRKETIVTGCQGTNGATRENTILVDKATRKFALEHFDVCWREEEICKKIGKDKYHLIFPILSVRRGVEFYRVAPRIFGYPVYQDRLIWFPLGRIGISPTKRFIYKMLNIVRGKTGVFGGYTESLKSTVKLFNETCIRFFLFLEG